MTWANRKPCRVCIWVCLYCTRLSHASSATLIFISVLGGLSEYILYMLLKEACSVNVPNVNVPNFRPILTSLGLPILIAVLQMARYMRSLILVLSFLLCTRPGNK